MSHKRNAEYRTPKDEWQTPPELFLKLHHEFQFVCDAAATMENRKVPGYYEDALMADWSTIKGAIFLNPPYSSGNIERFMQKAFEESKKGAVVVCLVPVASDTRWWHNYVMNAQEIRFIKGRVKYVGYDENGEQIRNSPTFASCVVIFWPKEPEAVKDAPRIGRTINMGDLIDKGVGMRRRIMKIAGVPA